MVEVEIHYHSECYFLSIQGCFWLFVQELVRCFVDCSSSPPSYPSIPRYLRSRKRPLFRSKYLSSRFFGLSFRGITLIALHFLGEQGKAMSIFLTMRAFMVKPV